MSAICRNTARSRTGCTSALTALSVRRSATRERYCRRFATVKPTSLLEHDHEAGCAGLFRHHVMAFGLRGARQIARPARIVEDELQELAAVEVGERDLGLRPRERAGHAHKIQSMRRRHDQLP